MKISTPLNGLFLLLLLTIGMVDLVHAQAEPDPLVFNNGAMFFINGGINDSAVVWVDGTFTNNDSTLVNLGKLIVKNDFINNAQCGGDNTFPLQIPGNNGMFDVYGDWENNGIFYAGTGKVRFFANDTIDGDSIQGVSITRFHDVELMAHNRRVQDSIDTEIDPSGTINLHRGEWATDVNILWVFNPAVGAVQRNANCDTCGFVSSLDNGNLARAVAQNTNYLFPTGSRLNVSPNQIKRYRPVIIKPQTNAVDTFHVRFVNRNATINGLPVTNLDTNLCYVNPWWYHRINKDNGGVAAAEIDIRSNPFAPLIDEDYNTMANWSTSNAVWEDLINTASGVVNFYPQVGVYNYSDFATYPEDAYILGFRVPPAPEVTGDTALCANVPTTYSVPDNGSSYDFVVTGGTVIAQDSTSVTVIWHNDSLGAVYGSVDVLETIPNSINGGCTSHLQNYSVEIWPLPIANFSISTDTTLPGGIFVDDILGMVDSSILTSEWYWDFGDGVTSNDSTPYHTYGETGTYDIQLIVRSGLECLDTMVISVNVVEGMIIPNVFTPNGDGWNDVFDVRTSAVGDYKLQIYNRWGNIVFENTSPLISWDGTTSAGVQAPAGTYFYVITNPTMVSGNAIEDNGDNFSTPPGGDVNKGWLQLIR
ncbi:MAG: T9SS type B sorting domain-containing protein [Flavobacteriales bacterium]|nr:T9SS type B sorting domain-containing protein [Flavobacteriales bacterium]